MSRRINKKKAKGGRFEDYPTPRWCIERFIEADPAWLDECKSALEPCAGRGRIIDVFEDCGVELKWSAIEIQPRFRRLLQETVGSTDRGRVVCGNADRSDVYPYPNVLDLIITNPPFSSSFSLVKRWVDNKLAVHVVVLLRMGFLESKDRNAWLRANLPHDIYVIPNRPSFTADGQSDQASYGWFHWDTRTKAKHTRLHVLPNTEREDRV